MNGTLKGFPHQDGPWNGREAAKTCLSDWTRVKKFTPACKRWPTKWDSMLPPSPAALDEHATAPTATWTTTTDGSSELVTLQGNLARRESGEAFTHLHATFSDDDLKPHAGHMFEATVHVVAEIHLRLLPHAIMSRCPLENSEFVALKFD